jgi:hypothetical protein
MSWRCPYCEQIATIVESNISGNYHAFDSPDKKTTLVLETSVIRCPNVGGCGEYTLDAALYPAKWNGARHIPDKTHGAIMQWKLRPSSSAMTLPEYIPKAVRSDYEEACLISDLSPKASATLSRRCLQGMIRDFYKVKEKNLYLEVQGIKDKVDPTTWQAIDAVRNIGNIGAHMEADIDLIVDVDPGEAVLLIGLIETLINEWYVHRHQRAQRMNKIVAVAAAKKAEKESGKAMTTASGPENTA